MLDLVGFSSHRVNKIFVVRHTTGTGGLTFLLPYLFRNHPNGLFKSQHKNNRKRFTFFSSTDITILSYPLRTIANYLQWEVISL